MLPIDIVRIIIEKTLHQICPIYTKKDAWDDIDSLLSSLNLTYKEIEISPYQSKNEKHFPHDCSYYFEKSCFQIFGMYYPEINDIIKNTKVSKKGDPLYYLFPEPQTLLHGRTLRSYILHIFKDDVVNWVVFYVNKQNELFWENTEISCSFDMKKYHDISYVPYWFIEAFFPLNELYVPWQNFVILYSSIMSLFMTFSSTIDEESLIPETLIDFDETYKENKNFYKEKIVQFLKKNHKRWTEGLDINVFLDFDANKIIDEFMIILDKDDKISKKYLIDEIKDIFCDNDDILYPDRMWGKRCKIRKKKMRFEKSERLRISNLGLVLIEYIQRHDLSYDKNIIERSKIIVNVIDPIINFSWIAPHLIPKYIDYIIQGKEGENLNVIDYQNLYENPIYDDFINELFDIHNMYDALKQKIYAFDLQSHPHISSLLGHYERSMTPQYYDWVGFHEKVKNLINEKRYALTCSFYDLKYSHFDPLLKFAIDITDMKSGINSFTIQEMQRILGKNQMYYNFGFKEEDLSNIRQMFDRYILLQNALQNYDLEIPRDSKVCANFVVFGSYKGPFHPLDISPLEKVVDIMREMSFFCKRTNYLQKRKLLPSERSKMVVVHEILKSIEIFSSIYPKMPFFSSNIVDEFPTRIKLVMLNDRYSLLKAYEEWQRIQMIK